MITKTDIQNNLGVTIDSSLDGYIATIIGFAKEFIELTCGNGVIERRLFNSSDTPATRYYDANGETKLLIDDFREVTELVVNGVTLTENKDFYLYPLNNTVKEWIELIQPETRLNMNSRIGSVSPYIFDIAQKGVKVTGKIGYSTVAPDTIKMVATRLCASILKDNLTDKDVKEITSESLGDYSVSYATVQSTADRLKLTDMLALFMRKPINNGRPKVTMRQV